MAATVLPFLLARHRAAPVPVDVAPVEIQKVTVVRDSIENPRSLVLR
jgi:hypothetical protein